MGNLAQIVLTDVQALQTSQALGLALENSTVEQIGENEESLKQLAMFYGAVAADPARFPLSPEVATRIRKVVRAAKGPAQPTSRRNPRKERQASRMSFAKRRRRERQASVEEFNDAQQDREFEQTAAQAAFEDAQASLEHEPKFDIVAVQGNTILAGIPQSMVRANEPESVRQVTHAGHELPARGGANIVLPAKVEKAQEREGVS